MLGKLLGRGDTEPRRGTPDPELDEPEFRKRFLSQFPDPAFVAVSEELQKVAAAAWDTYHHHRKNPHTRKAGDGFADPEYELADTGVKVQALCPGVVFGTRSSGDRMAI